MTACWKALASMASASARTCSVTSATAPISRTSRPSSNTPLARESNHASVRRWPGRPGSGTGPIRSGGMPPWPRQPSPVVGVHAGGGLVVPAVERDALDPVEGKEAIGPGDDVGDDVPLPRAGVTDCFGIPQPAPLFEEALGGLPQRGLGPAGLGDVEGEADPRHDGALVVGERRDAVEEVARAERMSMVASRPEDLAIGLLEGDHRRRENLVDRLALDHLLGQSDGRGPVRRRTGSAARRRTRR